jgi:hypothetical protein
MFLISLVKKVLSNYSDLVNISSKTKEGKFFTKYSLYHYIIDENSFIYILHFSFMYTCIFMYFLQQYNKYLNI